MVRVYTWHPATPTEVLIDGVLPDAGHCAIEVIRTAPDGETVVEAYASFWPELDSLLGQLARPFKERPTRYPESFVQECDPDLGYMQRPPDHIDTLTGLREEWIVAAWARLKDSPYSLRHWNCSSVAKYLLVHSLPPGAYEEIKEVQHCSPEDWTRIASAEGLIEALATLPALLIDCRPDDVHRLAEAYLAWFEGDVPSATQPITGALPEPA